MLLHKSTTWTEWFYVVAPLQIYCIIVMVLVCYGEHGDEHNFIKQFFRRISDCLERWTGYPGWTMAGALSGLLMLGTVAIGLYWDVGFHVDFGRDAQLFTPSHTMIVIGLAGLVYSAGIAILFASLDEAEVGFRVGFIRVPWTALTLLAFGAGGLAAFPADAMWHQAYGVDVTLWSPTHLQMIGGGVLATIGLWLMLREGRRMPATPYGGFRPEPTLLGRAIEVTIFGAVLVGLSAVQGEFDFGVPQFQVLYLPLLIAAAAGASLVLARIALGPWGAAKTVLAFLIIRGVIAVLVGGPFNETVPHFPLYIVAAGVVEAAAFLLGTEDRLRFALVSGAAIGTVGVAAEIVWLSSLSEIHSTTAGLPKVLLLSPIAGIAAALLGGALARPVGGGRPVPAVAALVGGLALVATLAYPLPRNVGHVEADIRLRPVGDRAVVEVDLQPADAAKSATGFGIVAWQGGGRVSAALDEVSPGKYVSSKPLPVSGRWKTMVGLQRGDQVMAVPVYFPADPEIGAAAVEAVPERHETFVRNTTWLLREQHAGDAWVASATYSVLAVVMMVWIGMYALCVVKLTPTDDDDDSYERPYAYAGYGPKARNGGDGGNGHGDRHGGEDMVDDRYGLTNRQIVAANWGSRDRPPGD